MANCSFIKATEARNRARNDTLIWTEICEIQTAILAAIDGNQYSTIVADGTPFTSLNGITDVTLVSGGTGYSTVSATATILPNGTSPSVTATVTPVISSGGVIQSFNITNGGAGYDPVSATASLQDPSNLNDSQTNANFDGAGGNGTFTAGDDYFSGEVITLSENSTVTVTGIAGTGFVTIASQTQANYDGVAGNGIVPGGLPSGVNYVALEEITLQDGTVIRVDSVDGSGGVLTFTVLSSSTNSFPTTVTTLIQTSTDGVGSGFAIQTGTNNETAVGTITTFNVASPANDIFFLGQSLGHTAAGTTGIGSGFTLVPSTLNATTIPHAGLAATLTPIVTNGVVTSIVINNGGSGYTSGNPILITHPNGSGAALSVASVDGSGTITGYVISSGGTGYQIATAQVSISHPTGSGFVGVVNTTSGVITSISVQDGGFGYTTSYPTVTVNDATGSGAQVNIIGTVSGTLTQSNIQLAASGSGYSVTATPDDANNVNTNASLYIIGSDGVTPNNTATFSLTVGDNGFSTDSTEYYAVLSGQATDVVIADQIQYVLDYFTALGYNIRAQVNPATGNTLQWQIIW